MPAAAFPAPAPATSQDVAVTVDPAFTVRVERRLTDRSRTVYVTVNDSTVVTVNGQVVP